MTQTATTLRMTAPRDARTALAVLCAAVLLAVLCSGSAAAAPGNLTQTFDSLSGSGTAADPYVVTGPVELQSMSEDPTAHYELGSDVDAANTTNWNGGAGFDPVGSNSSSYFEGHFDGSGYTVEGITVNRSNTTNVGLFGLADGGATMTNVSLAGGVVIGDGDIGGLLGYSAGDTTISDVHVDVAVKSGDDGNAGGLVGVLSSENATVTRSSATCDVSTEGHQAGGLIGTMYDGHVRQSKATGDVYAGQDSAGGLVGYTNREANITNSYATGNATAGGSYTAGLVANHRGTITNSYATGNATAPGGDVGGLIGYNSSATTTDSYWDVNASGLDSSAGGTGLTTPEMTGDDARSNVAFDFRDTWFAHGDDYPRLQSLDGIELVESPAASPGDWPDGGARVEFRIAEMSSADVERSTLELTISQDEATHGRIEDVTVSGDRLTFTIGRSDVATVPVRIEERLQVQLAVPSFGWRGTYTLANGPERSVVFVDERVDDYDDLVADDGDGGWLAGVLGATHRRYRVERTLSVEPGETTIHVYLENDSVATGFGEAVPDDADGATHSLAVVDAGEDAPYRSFVAAADADAVDTDADTYGVYHAENDTLQVTVGEDFGGDDLDLVVANQNPSAVEGVGLLDLVDAFGATDGIGAYVDGLLG